MGFKLSRRKMTEELGQKLNEHTAEALDMIHRLQEQTQEPEALREQDMLSDAQSAQLSTLAFQPIELNRGDAERGGYSNYSYWRSTLGMFAKNRFAVFLSALLIALVLFTFVQPYLPNQRDANRINDDPATGMPYDNLSPGKEYWLGTNSIGQDLWSRIWFGARSSLYIGFTVAVSNAVVGIMMGLLWGYVRKLDFFFTELYNTVYNIPQTIVLILISYVLRPGMNTMIIAMAATGWLDLSKFIRNQVIIIRDRDFNLASRCLGTPTWRVIARNLLPQMVSVVMLRVALTIPQAIGNEVFLTYIGLGLPITIPSLGNLVNEGRKAISVPSLRYQLIAPAVVLSIVTISFYLIGNAFSDAADPRNHV